MGASKYEQELAQTSGVTIHHWARPVRLLGDDRVTGVEFERTELDETGSLQGTGTTWTLDADVVFKAVGQTIAEDVLGEITSSLEQKFGKLVVDDDRKTALDDVWAGGDIIVGHDDLTVSAVQDGKVAAIAIDKYLRGD
jgi:glutamate synthase (NADPH/NADH) small chain